MRDRTVQQRGGLSRRIALERVLGGEPQIPCRSGVIAGAVEMAREITDDLILAAGEHAVRSPARHAHARVPAADGVVSSSTIS